MSITSFRDLRRLLVGYEPGAWFHIPDFWGGKPGPRPFVAPNGWDLGPTAVTLPRTTSEKRGRRHIAHAAHPPHHAPGCRIDKPGAIVQVRLTVSKGQLDGCHMCDEPDEALVRSLQQFLAGGR
jgi:hypothetical protein